MKEYMKTNNVTSSATKPTSRQQRSAEVGGPSQAKTDKTNKINEDLQNGINDMMQGQIEKMQAANKSAILKMAEKMKESAAEDEDDV